MESVGQTVKASNTPIGGHIQRVLVYATLEHGTEDQSKSCSKPRNLMILYMIKISG